MDPATARADSRIPCGTMAHVAELTDGRPPVRIRWRAALPDWQVRRRARPPKGPA